jgi:predicted PurR-regulated permease PerM
MIPIPKEKSPIIPDNSIRTFRFELAPKTIVTLAAGFAAVWLLFNLLPVLLVLIAAFFMVGTLNPVVLWLENKKIRRSFAITIVFVSLLIVVLALMGMTIPALLSQVPSMIAQEPALRTQLADWLSGFPLCADLAKWLRNYEYSGQIGRAGAAAFAYSIEALRFVTYAMSAVFLALYIMIDHDRLRGGLFSIVPRSHHIRLSRVLLNLQNIVGAYIRGQLITCAFIGTFILLLLTACRIENALAFAVFGAVADVLPYLGVFISIGVTGLAAVSKGSVVMIIVIAMMYLYMEFEARVLVPKVYGRVLRLPSTVVLFSLLAGGTLMGIVGILLAIPFAAAIMMLIEELRVHLPGAQELSTDEVLQKKDDKGEKEYKRRTKGMSAEQSSAIAVKISGDRAKEEHQRVRKVDP